MILSLQWRHNRCDGVSNHQPHGCLLNRWFGRRSMKASKLRVTGLCAGNSLGTGEFPVQMASNAENASIWWYRSMKNFNQSNFSRNLDLAPFHVCEIFDDVNDIAWAQQTLLSSVIDSHALWNADLCVKIRCLIWTGSCIKPSTRETCGGINTLRISGILWKRISVMVCKKSAYPNCSGTVISLP